jgi:hypothetical protein
VRTTILRAAAGLLLGAALHVAVYAADALAELGVTEPQAKDALMTSLTYGRLPLGLMGQAFVKLPPETRGAVVTGFASWARAYTSSPEFKEAYAQNRAAKKPPSPDAESQMAWQAQFPEDPQVLIARRLRELLDTCADVDFDAKLDSESGVFVDAEHEDKSNDWKLCYRAGRESVTAGRAIATAWLGQK